ncbi:MAG: RluA family pseudouridine synthase [Chitinophagaceae bacterium]|nr:RluA family pseudouridine synthase [Chitinophagaceae bacterium]
MFQPEIISETENFIVVNKPAGLLTVPDRFDDKLPSLKKILENKYGRIFIVHRLDRDTSGIILFAKNETAHRYYSQLFENREAVKIYLGLVHGSLPDKKGTIDVPIAEHPVKKGRMVTTAKGKPSVTHYEVLEDFSLYSLVQFQIETGRTHQIRVHMQHLGNPIACDELYGTGQPVYLSSLKRKFKLSKQEEERPLLQRLGLHSWQLHFKDESGKLHCPEAPLPKDLRALLQQLRKWKQ